MRKKLRRGGGEFIGFAIGMIGLCTLILMLLGVFQLCMASSQLENAANLISRDIVSEESLDDARAKAQTDAENLLGGYQAVDSGSINTEVEYAPGSDREWKKGNYIKLFITVKLNCRNPIVSGKKTVSALVMIERDG